jgi:DDE superfamily endonuclease
VNHWCLVFVDETAVKTAMTRRRGRVTRGERVHDSAPRDYGSHTSVIGAMGLRGLVATLAVEGAVETLCFDAYLEWVLGPRLRRGDVVVLDNPGAHRASRIEGVAAERGAQVLWLVPYSHCWNPRWQVWYGGGLSGKTCQRAPDLRIHSTPFSTSRVSRRGRPRSSSRRGGPGTSGGRRPSAG